MSTISKPVAFILGYGPNLGQAIARKFKEGGFNVAVSSRRVDETTGKEEGYLGVQADFGNIDSIRSAFDRVEKELGPPAAVIYTAYSFNIVDANDPLANNYETFLTDATVSGINLYEVARRAKAAFEKLPADVPRAYIATGNLLPWVNLPYMLGMSVGKRASANIVEACATAYGPQGHRFYYAHEVNSATGGAQIPPTSQAHDDVFYRLYNQKEQGAWRVCFTETGALYDGEAGRLASSA
ncbi:hypothetical protein FRC04_007527 [Tulasnella sp. 424]|nr:hypothetical protein FRC04_007527 [Tulasnella sp. 424]KAG8959633.1 hypothetical protein FRC05_007647 [Tulasnella sp. 425]